MNKTISRESRSVRLDDHEWATAEAIARMGNRNGAGHGIRAALNLASYQIISEGDGQYGEYLCPASGQGDHVFTNAYDGSEPAVGESVTCGGGDGFFCGYGFTWRGAEVFVRLVRQFEEQAEKRRGGK